MYVTAAADAWGVNALTAVVFGSRVGLVKELSVPGGHRTGLRVLGPVSSIGEATDLWTRGSAQLVVVDAELPAVIDVVRGLSSEAGGIRILLAGDGCVADLAADALAAGACGVLPLPANASVIAGSCARAVRGELVLPDALLAPLMEQLRGARNDPFLALTARERQVLVMVAEGKATSEVASVLGIGVPTVHTHVRGMLTKLGVRTTMEAVRMAWREGMVELPVGA
jgi:DNA-binding NarL/FixJ family response regulator